MSTTVQNQSIDRNDPELGENIGEGQSGFVDRQESSVIYDDISSIPIEMINTKKYLASIKTIDNLRKDQLLIDRCDIELGEKIGEGQFGFVYKGLMKSVPSLSEEEVAIKSIKSSILDNQMNIDSFLKEGLIMKKFRHKNVLSLIGICFEEDGSPMVVLPLMQNRDLLSYIRDSNNHPKVKQLMIFGIDVAKGMEYLASNNYVHRDLAARNCVLDNDLCVKIADFGLSRHLYDNTYYRTNKFCKLPVRWMAPECLEKGIYTDKTDVWSYGVLVWELLTRGVIPYPHLENAEILYHLKKGRRLDQPKYCPHALYLILLKCWSEEPNERLDFVELIYEINEIIIKLENELKETPEYASNDININDEIFRIYYNSNIIS